MTDAEINNAVGLAVMKMRGAPLPGVAYYDFSDYANSLDAIMPVVRDWCAKLPYKEHQWGIAGTTASGIIRARVLGEVEHDTNPARALCLAFLQAVEAAARDSA